MIIRTDGTASSIACQLSPDINLESGLRWLFTGVDQNTAVDVEPDEPGERQSGIVSRQDQGGVQPKPREIVHS